MRTNDDFLSIHALIPAPEPFQSSHRSLASAPGRSTAFVVDVGRDPALGSEEGMCPCRSTRDPDMRRSIQRPSTADVSRGPSIASSIAGGDNVGNSPASWPVNILGSKPLSRPPLPRPSSSFAAFKDQEGGNASSSGMFRGSDTALTLDLGAGVARRATPNSAQVENEKNGPLEGLQRTVSRGSGSTGAASLDSLLREGSLPVRIPPIVLYTAFLSIFHC